MHYTLIKKEKNVLNNWEVWERLNSRYRCTDAIIKMRLDVLSFESVWDCDAFSITLGVSTGDLVTFRLQPLNADWLCLSSLRFACAAAEIWLLDVEKTGQHV